MIRLKTKCARCRKLKPSDEFSSKHRFPGNCSQCRGILCTQDSIRRNPDKQRARAKFHAALKKGLLVPAKRCEDCHKRFEKYASDGSPMRYAHHEDYGRPLDVLWLCDRCHGKRHWQPKRKLREGLITRDEFDRLEAERLAEIPRNQIEARLMW